MVESIALYIALYFSLIIHHNDWLNSVIDIASFITILAKICGSNMSQVLLWPNVQFTFHIQFFAMIKSQN